MSQTARIPALACLAVLAACGGGDPAPGVILTVTGTETSPDGRMCALNVTARNAMARDAANIQVAYTATTDGRGTLSEYVVLGDLAAGEETSGRLFLTGVPCDAVETVKLTRAVCTLAPVASPPESCADAVTLDGGGVVTVVKD